jgi:hypothetical protein
MLSEIEIIAEMLFATYYSKEPEERNKLTKDWNRTFLLKITEHGTVLAKIEEGELTMEALESLDGVEYDLQMESDVETFTKFTVYKSSGLKDWFKRLWNMIIRKVKFKPFRKIRDAMRLAKIMGV